MGVMKDRHGTYYARLKVPVRLQAAVARERKQGKKRQSFLKKSLGTKDLREANVRAKLVLAGFDQTLSRAAAAVERADVVPVQRKSLNPAEIARMAEALFGKLLADDEAGRFGGRAYMVEVEAQLRREGVEATPRYPLHTLPEFGWSSEQLQEQKDNLVYEMQTMQDSKDSFALIPAVWVAGDPEATQGLSRLQQMALVRIPTKSLEAAAPEPAWATKVSLGATALIGASVVAVSRGCLGALVSLGLTVAQDGQASPVGTNVAVVA
jgi:hypothetical protein